MQRFRRTYFQASIVAMACLTLPACSTLSQIPPSPASAAQTTVLDEQAALGVEMAYQAAALSLRTGLRAGLIKGDTATKARAADAKAYTAVLAVRAAYDAANATDYGEALARARESVGALIALAN
jgi:hypothetical protein